MAPTTTTDTSTSTTSVERKENTNESTTLSSSFNWIMESEIHLFHAMKNLRPLGIDKHFKMIFINENFNQRVKQEVSPQEIWNHLNTLYDIESLDDNMSVASEITESEEFTLPDSDFEDLKREKEKSSLIVEFDFEKSEEKEKDPLEKVVSDNTNDGKDKLKDEKGIEKLKIKGKGKKMTDESADKSSDGRVTEAKTDGKTATDKNVSTDKTPSTKKKKSKLREQSDKVTEKDEPLPESEKKKSAMTTSTKKKKTTQNVEFSKD